MAQFTVTWIRTIAAATQIVIGSVAILPTRLDAQQQIRVATYNVSLHGNSLGEISERLSGRVDPQAKKIAAVIQIVRPDILLLNELDHETSGKPARLLDRNYFAVAQGNQSPIEFPYIYTPETNTGLDSGLDLDGNQHLGEPSDAWGFGRYHGQYAMAIYSRFPFDRAALRTFQNFRWSQLPKALRPMQPLTGRPYYDDATWKLLRLSSKNHVDVPIRVGDRTIHLLASHPTPPVFDGPEDRNGCRNHDEIRFWCDYVSATDAPFVVDDLNRTGGLDQQELFLIAGDLNSDATAGDSQQRAIKQLLDHPRVQDPRPIHRSPNHPPPTPAMATNLATAAATADFGDNGRLRVDYVLPSVQFTVKSSGVFWPDPKNDKHGLLSASDHRLVWVDLEIP